MSNSGKFVTVHGIDGTGKSTLVQNLESKLRMRGDSVARTEKLKNSNPFSRFKSEFADLSPQATLLYSLGSKAVASERYSQVLTSGSTIIKDRWVIDVFADQSHKGADITGFNFEGFLKPHLAVILTCNEATRMTRINKRENPTPDDLVPNIPGTRAYYFEQFLLENSVLAAMDVVILDTTSKSSSEIATVVAEMI